MFSQDDALNEQPTLMFSQIVGTSGAMGGQTNTALEGTRRKVTGQGEKETERRMVWVLGSSNVSRCKDAVLKTVSYDERVQVDDMPGRSFSEVMDRAKDSVWGNMRGKNLVAVHAGVNDVLKLKGRHLGKRMGRDRPNPKPSRRERALCCAPSERSREGG